MSGDPGDSNREFESLGVKGVPPYPRLRGRSGVYEDSRPLVGPPGWRETRLLESRRGLLPTKPGSRHRTQEDTGVVVVDGDGEKRKRERVVSGRVPSGRYTEKTGSGP